jgi:hypothetical protein
MTHPTVEMRKESTNVYSSGHIAVDFRDVGGGNEETNHRDPVKNEQKMTNRFPISPSAVSYEHKEREAQTRAANAPKTISHTATPAAEKQTGNGEASSY